MFGKLRRNINQPHQNGEAVAQFLNEFHQNDKYIQYQTPNSSKKKIFKTVIRITVRVF